MFKEKQYKLDIYRYITGLLIFKLLSRFSLEVDFNEAAQRATGI